MEMEEKSWDQLRLPPRHVRPEKHAEEEEIDTYRYFDDITWAPKDFDAPMRDEWDTTGTWLQSFKFESQK